jgi:hypothetical protein
MLNAVMLDGIMLSVVQLSVAMLSLIFVEAKPFYNCNIFYIALQWSRIKTLKGN